MPKDTLQMAVFNNASWCNTLCTTHGLSGKFTDDFWANSNSVPKNYPNLITLKPDLNIDSEVENLKTHLNPPWAIKDSFSDVIPSGFKKLFDATWIAFFPTEKTGNVEEILEWVEVKQEDELILWEQAYEHGQIPVDHLFNTALLSEKNITILAGYQSGEITAGAICCETEGTIGLSNVFVPKNEETKYWRGLAYYLSEKYPLLTITGYEKEESLKPAIEAGFKSIGNLRVWEHFSL
jgi:hypothetical protein